MLETAMRNSIATRELITLDCDGTRLHGTYHRVTQRDSSAAAQNRVGVLFVNSLSLPRAASGDSAVHWADAIAALGYPSFRIDLPGLGDSQGQSSTDLLDLINAGGFTAVAASVVNQLIERYRLTGIILFGHCAGSVSALYAGAASPECKGLILLDPYFHLPQAKRARVREELSDWARRSKLGRLLSNVYDRVRSIALIAHGSAPPGNANAQLLTKWKQVATAGLPVLLLKAPGIKAQGAKPRLGEFDYIDYVVKLAGKKSRVAAEFVEGADHSFANRRGRDEVERHIDRWLAANFPLPRFELNAAEASPLRGHENNANANNKLAAPVDRYCALEGR
jgi:pimeloyl-ACP methyl ester carboxylesterase